MRNAMNRLRQPLWAILALLLLAAFVYLQLGQRVSKVSAQAGCSVGSFTGSYGFLVNKWTSDPNSGASAVIGVLTADGSGSVSGSFTSYNSNSGTPLQTGTVVGTYSINPDCRGSMSLTTDTGDTPQLVMVITDAGSNAQLMQTNNSPNSVQTGTARRQ